MVNANTVRIQKNGNNYFDQESGINGEGKHGAIQTRT